MSRKGFILVASWLITLAVFSQGLATSARIAGMGGVSIVVDDLESDPLVNPAKTVRISRPLILGNFSHQGYSYKTTYEWSDVDHWGDDASYRSANHKYKDSPSTLLSTGACFYPLVSGIVLGGLYQFSHYRYFRNLEDYSSERTTSGDTTTWSSWSDDYTSWEDKVPQNVIWLLGGAKITPQILIGFGTELILESIKREDDKWERTYWSSGMSDTSHHSREWEYKTTFSQKEFTGGILINLSEELEIDGTFSFSRYDQNHRQTKDVRDSTVIDPDSLSQHRDLAKEDFYFLSFAPKYRLNDLVRMGLAISYSWSKRTNSEKNFGVKTDTGKEKFSSLNIGFGLSLTPDEKTLIALDLIFTPQKSTQDFFYTETETTSTGEIHQKGDVSRTEKEEYFNKTVRVGMERKVSDNLSIRIGSNLLMGRCDYEVEDKEDDYNSQQEYPSSQRAVFTAGFGWLWQNRIKVDYALQAQDENGRVDLHHQLNLTYSL